MQIEFSCISLSFSIQLIQASLVLLILFIYYSILYDHNNDHLKNIIDIIIDV